MEKSAFDSLFGFVSTTTTVVDEPPPAELDALKIPMKIVGTCYEQLLFWRWNRPSW